MRFADINVGDLVHDVSDPIVLGYVESKKKTTLVVNFCSGIGCSRPTSYDVEHCQFLRKES